MKILACVTIGNQNIIQEWEADEKGENLIISNIGSKIIAIPLERTKLIITVDKDELRKKVEAGLSLPDEHFEAVFDSFPRAFLGTLNISDAVILKTSN